MTAVPFAPPASRFWSTAFSSNWRTTAQGSAPGVIVEVETIWREGSNWPEEDEYRIQAASLRNDVVNDATMDIGESKIPAGVPVRQFLMIETE